jgi:tetratricopeptide (TPR) repeat protein
VKIEINRTAHKWLRRVICVSLIFVFHFSFFILTSCSTQKANWSNIQFHNTTAHYNIWWNGNESLKQGLKLMETTCKDDYTRLLPVYKVATKEESMALYPQFDRAIEKSIKGIKKHSIFINGQEHVPYIAKCYILTAYATFYKHDLANSASTCQMLVSQYGGTPIADEAAILQARCATLDKRYQDAESALDELVTALGKGNFAPKQKLNLYLAMAECTLPQEKYKKGVQFLKLALDEHPSRQQKARIYYILGQIYQELDKRPTASKYYEKVLKCSPSYEMEFNARLNLASCADLQHTDREKLERLLDRMLKDRKNEDFLDQIYYAKGEMYMGMRDIKKACEAFRTSSAVSKTNPAQKARSAIRLGGILYDRLQDYDNAQTYYDTAMAIIRPDYPHYADHKSRYDLLTSLVAYTRVIDRNDSLIAVANMPESERLALINDKIAALKKAEEEAKERELLEQFASDAKSQQNTLQGDWYFYNSNTVQKGKETFRQRWGMRSLEDYWFLSKKGMLGMNMLAQNNDNAEDEGDEKTDADGTGEAQADDKERKPEGNPNDPHNVAYYLKDLPQSPEDLDSMQAQTAVCLLNAGYIYYDGIHDIPKALECYLRMTNDYTTNSEIVQAFFMLYKIYDRQGNTPNSNYYRDMVLMGFPDSDFANLILDEDYYKEILRRSQLVREDYDEVYTLYRKHRYDDVLNSVATAKELYTDDPMLGKFRYWEALAYARTDRKDRAIATLQGIIADYPKTDSIVPLALAQLDFLMGDGSNYVTNSGPDETVTDPAAPEQTPQALASRQRQTAETSGAETATLPPEAKLFRYKADMAHQVIILVKEKKIRATQLQTKVGTFIMNYYANSGYKTSPLMFTDSTQMVTISTFNNANEAKDFATHLQRPEGPLADYSPDDYQVFAISKQNYTTLYNRKRVDAYRQFYDKYYQNGK